MSVITVKDKSKTPRRRMQLVSFVCFFYASKEIPVGVTEMTEKKTKIKWKTDRLKANILESN